METASLHSGSVTNNLANVLADGIQSSTPNPLPPNVTELSFDHFFKSPVGDRGLEFTESLCNLDEKIVRITGYMINHVHANPRVFILSPVPLTFHQCEYGLCDDLPAASVHVKVAGAPHERIPYVPGLLTFVGKLSVGPHEEMDGRISNVRLLIEPAAINKLLHEAVPSKSESAPAPSAAENKTAASLETSGLPHSLSSVTR